MSPKLKAALDYGPLIVFLAVFLLYRDQDVPYPRGEYAVLVLEKVDTPYQKDEYAVSSIRLRRLQRPVTMQKNTQNTQMQKFTMQKNKHTKTTLDANYSKLHYMLINLSYTICKLS